MFGKERDNGGCHCNSNSSDTHASQETGQTLTNTCVLPIWRVYPKKLKGECGWNYMISLI